MKKIIFLFLFINFASFSQSANSKVSYTSPSITMIILENGKIINEIPYGKDVTIIYDTFFKSYEITFYDKENNLSAIKLNYLSDKSDGTTKTYDTFNKNYVVTNKLDKNGVLYWLAEKKYENRYVAFVATDAKKL